MPPPSPKAPRPPSPIVLCDRCNARACREPDPDGVRRCSGHSQNPERIEARRQQAEAGRNAGAIAAGRAAALETKAQALREGRDVDPTPPDAAPIDVDLKSPDGVESFLEEAARRLDSGKWEPQAASAAASLARAALQGHALKRAMKPAGEQSELERAILELVVAKAN